MITRDVLKILLDMAINNRTLTTEERKAVLVVTLKEWSEQHPDNLDYAMNVYNSVMEEVKAAVH